MLAPDSNEEHWEEVQTTDNVTTSKIVEVEKPKFEEERAVENSVQESSVVSAVSEDEGANNENNNISNDNEEELPPPPPLTPWQLWMQVNLLLIYIHSYM